MRSLIFIFSMLVVSTYAQTTNRGTIKVKKQQQVFSAVDIMPEFAGGDAAFMSFVQTNLKYPQGAIDRGVSGTCIINFVIEADGRLSGVRVFRGIAGCPECDLEALRVIMLMPRWKPGLNKGEAVRVQYNLPIKFSLK